MNGFCWPHCQIIIENSNIAKQALSQRRHLYLFNNIVFKTQFKKQNHNNLIVFIQNFFVFLKQLHPVMTQNTSYNVKQRSNCPKQDSDISDLLENHSANINVDSWKGCGKVIKRLINVVHVKKHSRT